MKFAFKHGWVPAIVLGVIAAITFAPADWVTEAIFIVQIFVLVIILVSIVSRAVSITTWQPPRRRLLIWSLAAIVAIIVSLEPSIFRRLRN